MGPDVTIPQRTQLMSEPQKDDFDSDYFGDDERQEQDNKQEDVEEGIKSLQTFEYSKP